MWIVALLIEFQVIRNNITVIYQTNLFHFKEHCRKENQFKIGTRVCMVDNRDSAI